MNFNTIAIFASFVVALFGILTNSLIPVVIGFGGVVISFILRETKRLDTPATLEAPVEVTPVPAPAKEPEKITKTKKVAAKQPTKSTPAAKRGPKPKTAKK